MNQWLATLSKSTIAFLAIAGAILIIIVLDPPRTVCDTQKDLFKTQQAGFLYLDPAQLGIKTTKFMNLYEFCLQAPGPGGCAELFSLVGKMVNQLGAISDECLQEVAALPAVKTAIWTTLDLMVRLAWMENKQQNYLVKNGWFDLADLSLFCEVKRMAIRAYGLEQWNAVREGFFSKLDGAKEQGWEKFWAGSIISVNCNKVM